MTRRHVLKEQNPHSYLDADRRLTSTSHLKERRDLAQWHAIFRAVMNLSVVSNAGNTLNEDGIAPSRKTLLRMTDRWQNVQAYSCHLFVILE